MHASRLSYRSEAAHQILRNLMRPEAPHDDKYAAAEQASKEPPQTGWQEGLQTHQ